MADSRVSVLIDMRSRLGGLNSATAGMKRLVGVVGSAAMAYVSLRGAISSVSTMGGFEESMSRVKGVTQGTSAEIAALSSRAQSLAEVTRFTAKDAADGMGYLAQAGFKAQSIYAALPGVLDLAAASQLGLAETADIASNILTGFSKSAEELNGVNDVLVGTTTSSNTNMLQLGEAMKFVAPLSNAAGMSIEETAAAIGLLGNAGIQGTLAGTSLRRMLSNLINPPTDAAAALSRLGIATKGTSGELLPMVEIIRQFEEAGGDASDAMEIFGQRAGPAFIALASQGSGALKEFTVQLENADGIAKTTADTMSDNLFGSLREVKSAWEGISIAVGDAGVLHMLTSGADGLAESLRNAKENIAGFIAVVYDAAENGELSDLIALTIEAGFEQGAIAGKAAFDGLFEWFGSSGDFWANALNGIMTFGVSATEFLMTVFETPIIYLSTGFRWIGEQFRVMFESVINSVIGGFETALNAIILKVNAITAALPFTDGSQLDQKQFDRIGSTALKGWKDLYNEQKTGIHMINGMVTNGLNKNLDASRKIIGAGADETERELTATQKLAALIEKKKSDKAAFAGTGSILSGPSAGTSPAPDHKKEKFVWDDSQNLSANLILGFRAMKDGWTESFDVITRDFADFDGMTEDFSDRMSEAAVNISAVVTAPFEAMFSSLSEGIEGLITGTKTWGEALRDIGTSVVSSLIKSFADMAASWVMTHVIMKGVSLAWSALSSTLKTKDAATTIAAESAKTPSLTTNALLSSISSYGGAIAIGLLAFAAVMALVGGFESGGYTGDGGHSEVAGVVHRGEYVIPAPVVSSMGVDGIESMIASGGAVTASPAAAAQAAEGGSGAKSMNVAVFDNRKSMRAWAETTEGETTIMNVLRKNKHEFS